MRGDDWEDRKPFVQYCNGKMRYFEKKSAVTAKNARWEQSHVELRIYQCPDCGDWHLTKQLRREKYDMHTHFRKGRRDK